MNSSEALVVLHLACDLAGSPARGLAGECWKPTSQVSEEESLWMSQQFEAGQKVGDLVVATGRSRATVLRHLKRHRSETGHTKLSDSDVDGMVARYAAGESTPQLAAEFGVHKDTGADVWWHVG